MLDNLRVHVCNMLPCPLQLQRFDGSVNNSRFHYLFCSLALRYPIHQYSRPSYLAVQGKNNRYSLAAFPPVTEPLVFP